MPKISPQEWTEYISHHPDAHILQTEAWGQLKNGFGWSVANVVAGNSGVQILFRKLPFGLSLAYIPKGPIGSEWDRLWVEVDSVCKAQRAIFLKVETDQWKVKTDATHLEQPPTGFVLSTHEIQPPRTLVIDLTGSEDQILARMKQKTRYNIRLARRKGVVIRQTCDIDMFYKLIQVTGERDTFGVHSKEYYQRALDLFEPRGNCVLLCAEFVEEPLAGLMVFAHGKRAWYFYGASSSEYRHLMPTYLLQWKAIQWAKAQGCKEYDLWGVPDEEQDVLEANFLERQDDLWGVYRFKRGFGGELRRAVQAWDRIYHPLLYKFYLWRVRS